VSLASMGSEVVLDEAASKTKGWETKVWGAHPSRVWCLASSPGTRRALALMQVFSISPNLFARRPHIFEMLPAGTPANYTRTRVLPKPVRRRIIRFSDW
jgi:hypothetical protein